MAMVSFSSVSSLKLWHPCHDLLRTLSRSNLDCGHNLKYFSDLIWLLACWCALFESSAAKLVLHTSFWYTVNGIRNSFSIHLSGILMIQKQKESTFLRNKVKCPRAQPLGKFVLKIPDSVAQYTRNNCTMPALLMVQTKHINKQAIKSLKYFDKVPVNKITTTVKVWLW